jgi:hypothetical protein
MSQFDLIAVPQLRAGAFLGRTITPSVGATERIDAPRRSSNNFVGSADFCRPRS